MTRIQEVGFLPLLDSGISGFSAEEMVDDDCRYDPNSTDGFYWPLWFWKGQIVTEMPCVYGKFFNKKAGFISLDWWADFCNYRRSKYAYPADGGIEGTILDTLRLNGSLISRDLRAACGFNGKGMRSKFDGYVTRLQMATYIVTEDFVYPHNKHNRIYGWGLSLLTTPEQLYGKAATTCSRTPQESYQRIFSHLRQLLPEASDKQLTTLIG